MNAGMINDCIDIRCIRLKHETADGHGSFFIIHKLRAAVITSARGSRGLYFTLSKGVCKMHEDKGVRCYHGDITHNL